ncbi:putative vacuolar protein sorting-associated protein TDA6 [Selaginella moellendorffii]|uniref:putative vacuolar protein sorting-associated protein TDA6 n=1 Tax=Selaginella moellendorffii TaxID=88036 RepID=UPI000D1C55C5|nr:putative vacuolar protein sorting-associated protein TDA6 [Selaginella moellendorffii]|eukprot:XP_024530301.1 putative vacuolar protein sorting-associated protein TDA6 [Selaginella moellendorffii]
MDSKPRGFGTRVIPLGEIEVLEAEHLEKIWETSDGRALFYKPVQVPDGFHALGCHARRTEVPDSLLLLVRGSGVTAGASKPAPLAPPVDYSLVWKSPVRNENETAMAFWLPLPPAGYKALGFVASVTKPGVDEVACVREDLTSDATISNSILASSSSSVSSSSSSVFTGLFQSLWSRLLMSSSSVADNNTVESFYVWQTRPREVGVTAKGLSTGTFYCSSSSSSPLPSIATLQNVSFDLPSSMPSLQQLDALVKRYAPIMFLHPDEDFFPCSVEWFFQNGALLYSKQNPSAPVQITANGANLPGGETNDGSYWLDLPRDAAAAEKVRRGNLESAITYLHVKPVFGGTFTDMQFWFYYPFNGPATLKVGLINVKLGKIGEHVSDWEHLTLRVDNFTGNLSSVYLGHHSSGTWYQPSDLEFDSTTTYRPFVYASKHGHALYAHPGDNLQGDEERGLGIRNDTKRSSFTWDVSKHQLISAAYLGVEEPPWLQFMREWGPKIQYNSRTELEKVFKFLPKKIRRSIEDIFNRFPNELSGEEGPTGPKQKNFWTGDER